MQAIENHLGIDHDCRADWSTSGIREVQEDGCPQPDFDFLNFLSSMP
jgi:hypothetical protein